MWKKSKRQQWEAPPMRVGVTGGIGSGKTTACKIFETLGIPVYYADERAKQLMVEDPDIKKQIVELTGRDAYSFDGQLNRAYLAGIVFNDSQKLEALNKIVHPAVHRDGLRWHKQFRRVPYTITEAALMIESGGYKAMDQLIVVTAPEEIRLKRVMQRDATSREAVLARMKNQMPGEEKLSFADFIIANDGQRSLVKQVWQVHRQLCRMVRANPAHQ